MKKITKKELKRLDRLKDRKKLKEWSLKVRERDGNKCLICGQTKYLNAHHIIPREVKMFRYNLLNGITLCAGCHRFRILSPHKNGFWFSLWLKSNRPKQYNYLKREICHC